MEKETQNQKKDDCPLCAVSEETIQRLKEKKQAPKEAETKEAKKPHSELKSWLPMFFIFAAAIALLSYQLFPQPSSWVAQVFSSKEQLKEGNEIGISDTIPSFSGVGKLAPDFVSEDVYGNKVSLADFRGKEPVLLVFWATWCGYCAKELPDLKSFTKDHQNEIKVVAVSSGESKETVQNYIEEKDVNFLMLLDESRKIWNQYLVRGTPSHVLIGREGEIVSLRPGLSSMNDLEIMLTMLK